MGFKKDAEISFDIVEEHGVIGESKKSNWATVVATISWNGREPKKEIRKIDMIDNKMGKGIALADEEFENLANLLVNDGYGDIDVLEKAIKKRKSIYDYKKEKDEKIKIFIP